MAMNLNVSDFAFGILVGTSGVLVLSWLVCLAFVFKGCCFFGGICGFSRNSLAMVSLITLSFSLAYISTSWQKLMCTLFCDDDSKAYNFYEYYICGIEGFISVACFYISLIIRLFTAFKNDDNNGLSKKEVSFLFCIILIVFTMGTIALSMTWFEFGELIELIMLAIAAMIIDIAFNLRLLYLFLIRLHRLMVALDEKYESLMESMSNSHTMTKTANSNLTNYNNASFQTTMNSNNNINQNNLNASVILTNSILQCHNINDSNILVNTINNTNYTMVNKLSDLNRAYDGGNQNTFRKETNIREKMKKTQKEKLEIVDLMTKFTVLAISGQIIQQIWFGTWLYGHYSYKIVSTSAEQNHATKPMWLINRFLSCFSMFCNCLILYLTFSFNNNQYILCCKLCHNGLKNCLISCISKYGNN